MRRVDCSIMLVRSAAGGLRKHPCSVGVGVGVDVWTVSRGDRGVACARVWLWLWRFESSKPGPGRLQIRGEAASLMREVADGRRRGRAWGQAAPEQLLQ